MMKKLQVTLTSNEGKRLIAKAAKESTQINICLRDGKILLAGGSTVSAFSEELGYGPLRLSGRIDASGTRTALNPTSAPHNLLIDKGEAINADKKIQQIVESMTSQDIIVAGANAIDIYGQAAIAYASSGGGSRGFALHTASVNGIPMIILAGLNKLIPDLDLAMRNSGRRGIDLSMGAAIGLHQLYGPIITEIEAFEILFDLDAVPIAASGIGSGEGSRTFVIFGDEIDLESCWNLLKDIKGAGVSGDIDSLPACHGGYPSCKRHIACIYKSKGK